MTEASNIPVREGTWPRPLQPHWDAGMIVASIAISLLGAFTSTQLMCQARMSVQFTSVLAWTILGSLTFGFCSVWSLHFVAMLACELDASIGIDVGLTLLSAILAVGFTFSALASDLLLARYSQGGRKGQGFSKRKKHASRSTTNRPATVSRQDSSKPIIEYVEEGNFPPDTQDEENPRHFSSQKGLALELNGKPWGEIQTPPESPAKSPPLADDDVQMQESEPLLHHSFSNHSFEAPSPQAHPQDRSRPTLNSHPSGEGRRSSDSIREMSSEYSTSRRSSSFLGSSSGLHALGPLMSKAYRGTSPAKNAFSTMGEALYDGCTIKNIVKSFIWSLAITSMHYVGIAALRVPEGYFTLDIGFVILSALISWVVCLVGCILMLRIETNLAQQCLFSVVASTGVAAMHFTGMSSWYLVQKV